MRWGKQPTPFRRDVGQTPFCHQQGKLYDDQSLLNPVIGQLSDENRQLLRLHYSDWDGSEVFRIDKNPRELI
jgi:hypothetical protein